MYFPTPVLGDPVPGPAAEPAGPARHQCSSTHHQQRGCLTAAGKAHQGKCELKEGFVH